MSRRERKQLFMLAATVVVVALLVMSLSDGSGGEQAARSPRSHQLATISGQRLGDDPGGHEIDRGADRADGALAQARRLARRFIVAFASYQDGPIDEPTLRRLHELATPRLARYLLAHPPRASGAAQARVRVVRLDLTGPTHGPVKAAALLDYGHRRRSLFELQLQLMRGSWRVSGLYP